jgi:prepilin-type N-terminal cleavage/methylation domain-containing protein
MLISIPSRRHQAGVTLIEMMVAIVVGLIVVAAVLAFIVSIMKANRQNIESTRLMQEMRATAAVIAADVRRARGVTDPLATVKLTNGNPYREIRTTPVTNPAGCISFGYDGGVSGPYRMIRRRNDKIELLGTTSPQATVDCTNAPAATTGNVVVMPLTSDQVRITSLTFQRLPLDAGTGAEPPPDRTREIRITMTGQLVNADADLANISRTISQSIYVRAIGTGS